MKTLNFFNNNHTMLFILEKKCMRYRSRKCLIVFFIRLFTDQSTKLVMGLKFMNSEPICYVLSIDFLQYDLKKQKKNVRVMLIWLCEIKLM